MEEDKQPIFEEMPDKNKDDDNQNFKDDGKIDSGHFDEGPKGGERP
jgi:hypothetical protein